MNKKGISAVVATVLIILITVAAVTIIWAAIIPMIKEQTVGGTTCLDAVSQVSIESSGGYTCWRASTGKVEVQVGMGAADFVLGDLQIIISEAGATESFKQSEATVSGDLPLANSEKVLLVTYDAASSTKDPEKVEIAPIVTVGNTEKTCDVAASAVLPDC